MILVPPAPATAAPFSPAALSAALTQSRVSVSSNFRGASIVLYGAVESDPDQPADIVVVVRGPDQPVRLVRKSDVGGLWLSSHPVVFEGAPSFYESAANRKLSDITDFSTLRRMGLGVDHLTMAAPQASRIETRYGVRDMVVNQLGGDYLDWLNAVIRLKQNAGLYKDEPDGVRFVDRGLFRAEIRLPPEAPTGRYMADVWLFRGGKAVSVRSRDLVVEKVGFERSVYLAAHRQPWLYGAACVLLGLAAGWAASRIFRRS
jgi:uncharacterized protein (TIGR02186 family)